MSQHLRRTLLAALCATAVVGLAACSPAATSGEPASTNSSGGVATTAAPAAHAAALPTGNKLASLLLPASAMPTTLKLDPTGSQDTGHVFQEPSTDTVSKAKACDALSGTSWIDATGIGGVSFAQNDYANSGGDMFAQEIDAFRGKDASTVMSRLKQVFTGCGTFSIKVDGTAYPQHLSWKALPGVGDEAVQAVYTSASLVGGSTLVAVRVGDLVVTTLDNDQHGTGSAGIALTERLAERLR